MSWATSSPSIWQPRTLSPGRCGDVQPTIYLPWQRVRRTVRGKARGSIVTPCPQVARCRTHHQVHNYYCGPAIIVVNLVVRTASRDLGTRRHDRSTRFPTDRSADPLPRQIDGWLYIATASGAQGSRLPDRW